MNDPNQPDANVQIASTTTVGQTLAFKVSGQGTLQARVQDGSAPEENASAQNANRPGGGLGPPINAPDPLQKYRWHILGGFVALLVAGAIYVASRQQAAARSGAVPKNHSLKREERDLYHEVAEAPAECETTFPTTPLRPRAALSSSSMLLEGLKEELFLLEVEHMQGDISQQEYDKTRAALDQTLERALKRETANQV